MSAQVLNNPTLVALLNHTHRLPLTVTGTAQPIAYKSIVCSKREFMLSVFVVAMLHRTYMHSTLSEKKAKNSNTQCYQEIVNINCSGGQA